MENLTTYEKAFAERTEKTLTAEAALPEYLPNAAKILKVSVLPSVDKCECTGGISVSGKVLFSVVYASDYRDTLKCAVFPCEFENRFGGKLTQAELGEGGFCECSVSAADESVKILNPRRLALSCVLTLDASATAQRQCEVFDIEENESIKKRTSTAQTLCITPIKDCEVCIEQTVAAEPGMPAVREVIFSDASMTVEKAAVSGGKCNFSGFASLTCMYLGEDDGEGARYVSFAKSLPFTASAEVGDVPEDAGVVCRISTSKVSAESVVNSYGDSAGCRVEITGKINGKVYSNRTAEICEDVFCTKHDCRVDVREMPSDVYATLLEDKAEISESVRMNLGSITELVSSSLDISEVRSEIADGRPSASVRGILRICGTNEQGALESASAVMSFRHTHDGAFDSRYEKYRLESEISAGTPVCRIENGEVKCTFTSYLTTAVTAASKVKAAVAVEVDDSCEYSRDASQYILYYPTTSDTLWSVAKKYRVSPDALSAANNLSSDSEIASAHVVVVPR